MEVVYYSLVLLSPNPILHFIVSDLCRLAISAKTEAFPSSL